jgi:hypothetical protein
MGGVRRSRWRSRPLQRPRLTQAAREEFKKKLDFVTDFETRAKAFGWNVDERIYAIAKLYLKVARSSPCLVRLLAATGPASCHGRCARTAA